jgi:palmitoyltransferase
MYCIECGQILPTILTNSTICSKCKTPVATWWDETSKTFRTNRESILPDSASKSSFSLTSGASLLYLEEKERAKMKSRPNRQTEEERVFNGALVVLEMHFQRPSVYMRDTMGEAKKMIAKTLDLSLNKAEVRYIVLFPA